jgi:hypothetical protein
MRPLFSFCYEIAEAKTRDPKHLAQALRELRVEVMVQARAAAVKDRAEVGTPHSEDERETEPRLVLLIEARKLATLGFGGTEDSRPGLFAA